MTTDEAPTGTTAPAARPHRVRNAVVIAAAFLVVLGAVTGGVLAFLAFDKATSIDRSTPQVVTDQFLEATLKLKDPNRVGLFVCDGWTVSDAMAAASPPTDSRVAVSWGDTWIKATDGFAATVEVRVEFVLSNDGLSARSIRVWTLTLRDEDGWRVCSVSSRLLNP